MTLTEALDTLFRAGRIKSAWLPGMRVLPHGSYYRGGIVWRSDGRAVCDVIDADGDEYRVGGPHPDTSDPLTVMGLLLLAREALVEHDFVVVFDGIAWAAPPRGRQVSIYGPTEKDAIIAALVAAAQEVARG